MDYIFYTWRHTDGIQRKTPNIRPPSSDFVEGNVESDGPPHELFSHLFPLPLTFALLAGRWRHEKVQQA